MVDEIGACAKFGGNFELKFCACADFVAIFVPSNLPIGKYYLLDWILDSGFWTGLDSGFWTGLWTGLLVLAGVKWSWPLLKNQERGASL